MKNGLLICHGWGSTKNIGDYIQSVAQEQFLDKVDCYVEREQMNAFQSDEKVNTIMNAWFMHHPENFPPSDSINPLYISFHIKEKIADKMLSLKAIDHLKKYAPIGCRDTATRDLLQKHGIDSYFSGCLTLTLGKNYHTQEKDDTIYFVDPYYELGGKRYGLTNAKILFNSIKLLIRHWKKVCSMKNFKFDVTPYLERFPYWLIRPLMCASFYDAYSKIFSDDVLLSANFILHRISVVPFANEEERMEYARNMVRTYAKAKLVVTSRLHCALPCLGVETPVIFVNSDALDQGKLRSAGRFGGNLELLHVMKWTEDGIIAVSDEMKQLLAKGKISKTFVLKNKDDYKTLRDKLIKRVESFLNI